MTAGDRILTVTEPWAFALIRCGKDVENRSWTTRYRGPVWIHAGKRKPGEEELNLDLADVAEAAGRPLGEILERWCAWQGAGGATYGRIVGRVTLYGTAGPDEDVAGRWRSGGTALLVKDARESLTRPAVRGGLGLRILAKVLPRKDWPELEAAG